MKSLAERQADRAQRKADNAAFSTQKEIADTTGSAVMLGLQAVEAIKALPKAEQEKANKLLSEYSDGFTDGDETYSDIFDGQGSLKSAGVGVVNPLIVPTVSAASVGTGAQGGNGSGTGTTTGAAAGWGEETANIDPANGNQNGQALDEAGEEGEENLTPAQKAARTRAAKKADNEGSGEGDGTGDKPAE